MIPKQRDRLPAKSPTDSSVLRTPQNPACPHHHAASSIQCLLENAAQKQAHTATVTAGTVTELGHALALEQLLGFNHDHPFPSHQHTPFCPFGQRLSPQHCESSSSSAGRKSPSIPQQGTGLESCCCPGSLSGSRCHFPSAGISARQAQGFLLSLSPGCQRPAPAPQATGAGRGGAQRNNSGSGLGGCWPMAVAEPCIPEAFWRGQISITD